MPSIPSNNANVSLLRRLFLALALFIVSGAPDAGLAAEPAIGAPAGLAAWSVTSASAPAGLTGWSVGRAQPPAPPMSSKRVLNWDTGEGKSYVIPAVEIPVFIAGLNGVDRLLYHDEFENGKRVYSSTWSTTWYKVSHQNWEWFDRDDFSTNQFGHPYSGSLYYAFARSAGLDYWTSLVYAFTGSFLWEMAGETTKPVVTDQIASGIAGTFFGEALFRMASLALEGGGDRPGLLRELLAAGLSPPTGLNRLVFGDRFKPVFPSRDPAVFWRLRIGEAINSRGSANIVPNVLTADYAMSYGLPGKPGYSYTRPFDYFNFELNVLAHAKNPIENIMIRGLLTGREYEAGDAYRGVWGLYGSYDYISPNLFRVSSEAVNLGTTAQWWLTRAVALQGSLLGGVGYGAGGVVSGPGLRDYHYGVSFQTLLHLRLNLADLALLEAEGREYYISGLGGSKPHGSDFIGRWKGGLVARIYGHHAIGLQYLFTNRDADYNNRPDTHQWAEVYSIVYTYLSDTHFGTVEWR